MSRPASPRRRRVRRAALLAVAGAAALPAAALAVPTISGSDSMALNPAGSPDFILSSPHPELSWHLTDSVLTPVPGASGSGTSVDLPTSLPDGSYILWATDADGQSTRSFTADSTPPAGGSLSLPDRTTTATLPVTATAAEDPTGPISYALVQGDEPPSAYDAPGVLPTSFGLQGLDGAKTLRLWARDAAGNAGVIDGATTILDRQPPEIRFVTPSDGAVYRVGASEIADYECDDALPGTTACTGTVPKGQQIDTGTVGSKAFTVTTTDQAGNSTSRRVTYTVVDEVKPTVSIAAPQAQKYEINSTHLADFSCEDAGSGIALRGCAGTVPTGNPIDTSTLGEHQFTVQATDNAGNTASAQVFYEVVDRVDPEPPGLVGPPDDTVTNQLRPKLSWTAATDPGPGGAPGSGIARYEVVLDGQKVADLDALQTSFTPGANLQTGNHVWRVRAVDRAGNVALSDLYDFEVDPAATPAPRITAAPPAATNDSTPTFGFSGAPGVQEYRWAVKQGAATVVDGVTGPGGPEVTPGPLPDGDYVFTVTQRTNGDHGTAAAHAFTVDTAAPARPVIAVRPAAVSGDTTAVFAWAGGEPGARYLWQLSGPGGVVVQGPVETAVNMAVLTVGAGSWVFQVRQVDGAGNPSPLSIPEPFTVVGGEPPPPPPPPPGGDGTAAPPEPKAPAPTVEPPPRGTVKSVPAPATRNARALLPRAGARTASLRPVLRWKARTGASLYNVQVFRLKGTGLTKVATAFPKGARYRVPKGKLAPGLRYVWRVWPYVKGRFPSRPLGISYFDVRHTQRSLAKSRLLAPRRAAARAGRAITVRWRAKAGTAFYEVEVSRGAKVVFGKVVEGRRVTVPGGAVRAKGTYRLVVRAGVTASDTAFSKRAWAQTSLRLDR